ERVDRADRRAPGRRLGGGPAAPPRRLAGRLAVGLARRQAARCRRGALRPARPGPRRPGGGGVAAAPGPPGPLRRSRHPARPPAPPGPRRLLLRHDVQPRRVDLRRRAVRLARTLGARRPLLGRGPLAPRRGGPGPARRGAAAAAERDRRALRRQALAGRRLSRAV
ncbi:MAG: hypothetical protein AVDCRST_MAG13-3548, partial [uncultured Solirubrobacteraceae bacterium]